MADSCTISPRPIPTALPRCPENIASDIDAILCRFSDWQAREKLTAYQQSLASEQERIWAARYIQERLCADISRLSRSVRYRRAVS